MQTETITDDMIRALRDEAGAAGDDAQGILCEMALSSGPLTGSAREACAAAITDARAMDDDDSKPFVRVVA